MALLLSMVGCVSAPRAVQPPQPSYALDAGRQSKLGRIGTQALAAALAEESAFHLLPAGREALAARLALVAGAERSIDLQYYILRADSSGMGLMAALWQAAERGVRVRLLLDDWGARPDDATLQRLAAHSHIEVRLFNPLVHPRSAALSLLLDFERTQQRMHNKLLLADSQAAIVGGRNIGDEYFSRHHEFEFGDVDVLTFGPVVPQMAAAFDLYWNDALSLSLLSDPVALKSPTQPAEPVTELWSAAHGSDWARRLAAGELRFFSGRATAVHDKPGKLDPERPSEDSRLGREIASAMGAVERELLIVSPYFVPGDGGVAQLRELAKRGVRVTVVTNTLAATDVPAVHAGYARYRLELLKAGLALYELRPDAAQRERGRNERNERNERTGSSRLSLHAKLMVADRSSAFIGSMNIDPRSQRLNTENGVVVASPALAAELVDGVQRALVNDAWRVHEEGEGLRWTGVQDGKLVTLDHDPGAGWWLRLQASLLAWLPIEDLL
ncbi:phospholipase D family protein [Paucibacter sp. B2R-40]|uniref:phospholipase D family protein n=1 Tax=Paucibacter sp. B2R-40 TaxID=2893554 RepID=UPI0021E3D800|nr:phospholipase D family protein [Paucibacter sp. B2R-40]